MTTSVLNEAIQKAKALTPDEQLRLIAHLAERVRVTRSVSRPRRKWREIRGMAPDPLVGEDAQVWVSRSRRESVEHRERQ